jgi:hypothetical protein
MAPRVGEIARAVSGGSIADVATSEPPAFVGWSDAHDKVRLVQVRACTKASSCRPISQMNSVVRATRKTLRLHGHRVTCRR